MSIFAVAVLTGNADDDPIAAKARRVWELTQQESEDTKAWIKTQKLYINRLKRARVGSMVNGIIIDGQTLKFPDKASKEAAIAEAEKALADAEARIKEYQDGRRWEYGYLTLPPKIGDFGQVLDQAWVVQIINENTMLVRMYYESRSGNPLRSEPILLMVRNYPNAGATDDAEIKLQGVFEVTGRETYKTVLGGTNTVLVIQPLNTKEIEEFLKKRADRK
jgi:hypothetical protein